MRMFDFLCNDCGEVTEKLVDTNKHEIECFCGGRSKRQISMPTVKLDGTDPAFPGEYDRWARIREENARIKAKRSYAEP